MSDVFEAEDAYRDFVVSVFLSDKDPVDEDVYCSLCMIKDLLQEEYDYEEMSDMICMLAENVFNSTKILSEETTKENINLNKEQWDHLHQMLISYGVEDLWEDEVTKLNSFFKSKNGE
jgi:hypothetical protein